MRIKEHVLDTIQKRARISAEIAGCLIEFPECMDGNSQREKAYRIAIQYFEEKQKDSKMPENVSCNNRGAIELQVLIQCYEESDGNKKREYAKKIANKLLETEEWYLMRITDEIKNVAFQIAIKYLEEQRNA